MSLETYQEREIESLKRVIAEQQERIEKLEKRYSDHKDPYSFKAEEDTEIDQLLQQHREGRKSKQIQRDDAEWQAIVDGLKQRIEELEARNEALDKEIDLLRYLLDEVLDERRP